MSTFTGGDLPARVRRTTTPQLPGRQQMVAGATPAAGLGMMRGGGLDAATAQRFEAVTQWLGMSGQLAGQLQQRHEVELQKEETFHRGLGYKDAQMILPQFMQRLDNGELDHLMDGEGDISEAVQAFVEEHVDDQVHDAYRDQYVSSIAPRLHEAVLNREQSLIDQTRAENSQLATEAGVAARSREELDDAIEAWMTQNPDASRTEALAEVVIPAARSHAELGSEGREQLEMALGMLGDRFPGEQRLVRQQFDQAQRQRRRERDDDLRRAMPEMIRDEPTPEMFEARLSRRFDDIGEARIAGVVEDYTRDRITNAARLGDSQKVFELAERLDDTDANNAFLRQQLDRAVPAMREEFHEQRLAETVDDVLPIALDWRNKGGLPEVWAQLGDSLAFEIAPGEEIEVTRQQVEQSLLPAARERMMQQVRQAMPDAEEAEVSATFEQQWLGFLGGNNLTDPQIRQRLSGVAAGMGGLEDEDQVPQRALAALDFYQRGVTSQPRVVKQHLGGEDDIELLKRATRIQQTQDVSPGQALIRAERNIHTAAPAGATASMIDDAVQQVMFVDRFGPFNEQAVNEQHVFDYLRSAVEDGVQDTGYSPEAVLEDVLEEFQDDFTLINGHWVNTSTVGMADIDSEIPWDAIGTSIAEQFTAANPAEGYEAGDLTLAPDGVNPNQWRLRDARGYVVPDAPVFTLQDIAELGTFFTGEHAWRRDAQAIRRQAERRVNQMRLTRIEQWRGEAIEQWRQSASLVDQVLKRGLFLEPSQEQIEQMMADVPSVDELVEQRMEEIERPPILDDPVLGPIAEMIREQPDREKRARLKDAQQQRRRARRRMESERSLGGDMGFGIQRRND